MQYLEQFLGILQEVEAVFDPASGNLCSLLSDLFPSLAFCLTWVREKDKKMLSAAKERGKDAIDALEQKGQGGSKMHRATKRRGSN